MPSKHSFFNVALVCLLAGGLLAAPAEAQRRGGGGRPPSGRVSTGRPGGAVVVRPVYVRRGFYGSLGWYPTYGWYPWYASPYGFYPFYGHGFGYGYGYGYPYGPAFVGRGVSSVRVQVEPRQTKVFVDGYFAGLVDDFDGFFQRLDLEPGEHEIQLYLEGHRTVTERLYLSPGKSFKLRHVMQPLVPGDPPEPPPAAIDPPPGVSGERGRFGPPEDRRGPRPGEGRIEREGSGQLAVRVQPSGAAIFIDGEEWQGPDGEERLVIHLAAGSHRIEVRRDGYRAFLTTVQIRPGETTPLNVSLGRE
jgi:hypothetical protein